ncbi:MAG TPA: methylenetetrahydrofolate dehydrogenase [Candidatus Fournierella merdavium]|uniref:methylenetetrahydrofolate dehydrogenase n=1 Tax=Candidatus Allofournierella merdavium TaxID=2838593 RepID=UPI001F909255|nr:methylenetetrahydrofolate dehydrogenase [Candidatus Fournierella merdavium]
MKARLPKRREFVISFPEGSDEARNNEAWEKLNQIVEDYKKTHNGNSVYEPTFIQDNEEKVKALQAEYGFTYTIEEK